MEVGAAATQAMAELKERLQDIYDEAKSQELCDNGGGEHGGSQACALVGSSHLVSQSRSTYLTTAQLRFTVILLCFYLLWSYLLPQALEALEAAEAMLEAWERVLNGMLKG